MLPFEHHAEYTSIYTPDPAGGLGAWEEGPLEIWNSVRTWRYYPTVTTLGDGKSLALDGDILGESQGACPNAASGNGNIPAILQRNSGAPSTWNWNLETQVEYYPDGCPSQNENHDFALSWYPFTFLLSDGTIFVAGYSDGSDPLQPNLYTTYKLDPTRTMWQSSGATTVVGQSAVYFQKREGSEIRSLILKAGGNGQSGLPEAVNGSDRVYLIDVTNAGTMTWAQQTNDPLPGPRVEFHLIALPDGKVMAIGGQPNDGADDPNQAIRRPAVFDPYAAEGSRWTELDACMTTPRTHHSVAVLLPSGAVFVAGGDGPSPQTSSYQVYKPPYFFQGPRPTISDAPDVAVFGTGINMDTPDASAVTAVRLVRPGAVTHSFDQNQRMLELAFTVLDSDTIRVTVPQHGNIAPPGYYMLFIATGANGTLPSESRWLRLKYYTPIGAE